MEHKQSLLDLSLDELRGLFQTLGHPVFIANQLFDWIYKKREFDFTEMSNLSKKLREDLAASYRIPALTLADKMEDPVSGSVKLLFKTEDGLGIESVILPMEDEDETADVTLCVSCQSGCSLGCAFCATAKLGFTRNLAPGEIVSQVLLAEKLLGDGPGRRITNLVFMGMGEPFLNYDSVLKAARILGEKKGYELGSRHITFSTSGVVPGILRLSEEPEQFRLAVSLHAAIQSKREEKMPIAKKFKLPELMDALKTYQSRVERRITVEYILLSGWNTTAADAKAIAELLAPLDYHLNLIPYNPMPEDTLSAPGKDEEIAFLAALKSHHVPYVRRKSRGGKIMAGCGQLGLFWKGKKL